MTNTQATSEIRSKKVSSYNNLAARIERSRRKAESKVYLQGIGDVEAKLAGDIQVGDIESRNCSYRSYRVVSLDRQTAKTIWYTVENINTGEIFTVRRSKTSLAPVQS
jgi:hypothetical protein